MMAFQCPITGLKLERLDVDLAEAQIGARLVPCASASFVRAREADVVEVLVREDRSGAYAIIDEIPVLLATELLVTAERASMDSADADEPPYQDVYGDMDFYNSWAEEGLDAQSTEFVADLSFLRRLASPSSPFPSPAEAWLRASPAIGGEHRVFRHLDPVTDRDCLQIGGRGVEGLTLVQAGAASVTVLSPMASELIYCRRLAEELGVEDRVTLVCGIAEAIPSANASFDRVLSRHCLHHAVYRMAIAEIDRVLAPSGRFASVDVWSAPLYALGIRLFGKMSPGVQCRPLDRDRLDSGPPTEMDLVESSHGAIFRYPLAVAQRKGLILSPRANVALCALEDRMTSRSKTMANHRSLVALLGSKEPGSKELGSKERGGSVSS